MLYQETVTLHFKETITKIMQLSQAFNQTFVLLVYLKDKYKDSIYHVDRYGSLIKEYPAYKQFSLFTMINQQEVAVPNVENNEIAVINLRTQYVKNIHHVYIDVIDEIQLFSFSISKRLCVKEISGFIHKQLKLSFYQGPLQQNPQKLAEYSKPKDKQYKLVTQGNNISAVVFYNQKNYESIDLIVVDLVKAIESKDNTLQERRFFIKIDGNISFSLKEGEPPFLRINYLWQIREDQYILLGITSTHNTQEDQKIKILNLRENCLKSSNMVIPKKYSLTGEVYLLDQYTAIDVFQPQIHQKQQQTISTLYLNHTERTFDILSERFQNTQTHKYVAGQRNNIIMASYSNYQVDTAEITIIQPMSLKNLYLQMLLHVYPDFDDDLLLDTIQLLNCL